jgi:hypothetical protein
MRHRQAARDNLAACHIDDDAAVVAPLAPAVSDVGAGHCADIDGTRAVHREPLRWQRSSGTSALMKSGRYSGRKLPLSLTVARQENSVLTKTGVTHPVDLAHADIVDVGGAVT